MTPNKLPPLPDLSNRWRFRASERMRIAAEVGDSDDEAWNNGVGAGMDECADELDEALRQSQSLPAVAVAGLVKEMRDPVHVRIFGTTRCIEEWADRLEALQADAREKGEACVDADIVAIACSTFLENVADHQKGMEVDVYAMGKALDKALSAMGATQPAQASEKDGCVSVPRDALLTEARRLRYRATETYGLGPAMTDAGAQMVHTAEALEGFASSGKEKK